MTIIQQTQEQSYSSEEKTSLFTNIEKRNSKIKILHKTINSKLIHQYHDHFCTSVEFAQESLGELSNYDNHPADTGTELFERGKDIALHQHREKELEDINEALHAIEEGTYG